MDGGGGLVAYAKAVEGGLSYGVALLGGAVGGLFVLSLLFPPGCTPPGKLAERAAPLRREGGGEGALPPYARLDGGTGRGEASP